MPRGASLAYNPNRVAPDPERQRLAQQADWNVRSRGALGTPGIAAQQKTIAAPVPAPSFGTPGTPEPATTPTGFYGYPQDFMQAMQAADGPPGGNAQNSSGDFWFNQQAPYGNPADDFNPIYQMQTPYGPTLQNYANSYVAPTMNNWLMDSYLNAPSNIYQATNDAWAQQSNINAQNQMRGSLINLLGSFMGNFGGGSGGFHDTASNQRAGGGNYTTSVNAGGMDPNTANAAVSALTNSHPGTNDQHGDLRRNMASNSGNNLMRALEQAYAGQQGNMESARAQEGLGLMNWMANGANQAGALRAAFGGPIMSQLMRSLNV